MKIVVDSDIPYIKGVFEPYADVAYIKGGAIDAATVFDADALIVRTRTQCNQALLGGSNVRIVATATIGLDHIDVDWCHLAGIAVVSAAGCNARAVSQWVFAALREMRVLSGVIGIVGVGNVGRQVEAMASRCGFDIMRCDPPRAAGGESGFVELDELLAAADVVTIHVPLLAATRDMVSESFLSKMKPGAVLLNSSRGEVVHEDALLKSGRRFALDVWQGEPDINVDLMQAAAIATPHIAGYSARGKAQGTQMVVTQVADFLKIDNRRNWVSGQEFALEMPENFDISAVDNELRCNVAAFEALRIVRPT